jgi:hypothetical protein
MLFDEMLRSPAVRRALAAGEAQVGRAVGKLLASERFTSGLQSLASSAAQAKETFDRGVRHALRAANLPSAEDVAALKRRLDEVESTLDGLAARIGRGDPDAGRARE